MGAKGLYVLVNTYVFFILDDSELIQGIEFRLLLTISEGVERVGVQIFGHKSFLLIKKIEGILSLDHF